MDNIGKLKIVESNFKNSIVLKQKMLKVLPIIVDVAQTLVKCIKTKNKILICGNGGSACDAQHFATELVNRFLVDRDPFPAISLNSDIAILTAISNDYDFDQVFAKQVRAIGKKNDVLIGISTSGNSANVVNAIKEAKKIGLRLITLIGGMHECKTTSELRKSDIEIKVLDQSTPRIQEIHILIIHCICELVEKEFFKKI